MSVVDDDGSVRESLPDLLKQFGFAARAFSSAEEFLASDCIEQTRCLLLDVAMPGMTGPDLQQELIRRRQAIPIIFLVLDIRLRGMSGLDFQGKLADRGISIPIIFITADRDMIIRQRLIEQGAVECLFKPFSDTALLEAVNSALHPK